MQHEPGNIKPSKSVAEVVHKTKYFAKPERERGGFGTFR